MIFSRMAANGWRNIGHAKWYDSLAVLEDPASPEFKAAVKSEDAHWSHTLQQIPSHRLLTWKKLMTHYQTTSHPISQKFAEVRFTWCGHTVAKQRGPAGYTVYLWIDAWHLNGKPLTSAGFGTDGWFYTLEDIGKGAEHLELTVWHWPAKSVKPHLIWRKDPVGPSVEIVGDKIYYSSVENLLRYPDMWVAPVTTGLRPIRLFHEPDKRFQISFMERHGTLFIHKANALDQMLGILDAANKIHWIAAEKFTLIPIGSEWYATNTHLVHFRTNHRIPLPSEEYIVDGCIGPGQLMLIVTTNKGRETLWSYGLDKKWKVLRAPPKSVGILNSILIFHDPTPLPTFLFRTPMFPDEVWEYTGGEKQRLKCVIEYPVPLKLPYFGGGFAQNGNIRIPYTWVSAVQKPRALLVEAYGAYGISSRRAYPTRWLPYLARGWAIAYVAPRGGREGGDGWYDGGRTAARKSNTFQDTAAAIQAIQKSLHIPPAATVFFGRSAGGWLAANIAQEYGSKLVASVYAEVPYVDVLRTTTNPSLPLTQLEYDEFGDPIRRPAEYRALRKISPVDTVKPVHPTQVTPLLVIRTALHDKQVLPYEALKWSARLRDAGWSRVYVGIDHDGGHFAAAKSMAQQRAEDAALLETAVTYQGTSVAKTLRTKSVKRLRRCSRKRSLRRKPFVGIAGRTRRFR